MLQVIKSHFYGFSRVYMNWNNSNINSLYFIDGWMDENSIVVSFKYEWEIKNGTEIITRENGWMSKPHTPIPFT